MVRKRIRSALKRERFTLINGERKPSSEVPRTSRRLEYYIAICAFVLSDIVACVGLYMLAFSLYIGYPLFTDERVSYQLLIFQWSLPADFSPYYQAYGSLIPFIVATVFSLNLYYGLYRIRGEFSFSLDAITVTKAMAIASLVITFLAFFYRGGVEFRDYSYSRTIFLNFFFLLWVYFILSRILFRSLQVFVRRRGANLIPVILVGNISSLAYFIDMLRVKKNLGYHILGYISPKKIVDDKHSGVHYLGNLDEIEELLVRYKPEELIFVDHQVCTPEMIFDIMGKCPRSLNLTIKMVPNILQFAPKKICLDTIGNFPLIKLAQDPLTKTNRIAKRTLDLVVLALASPLLFVVFAAIALRIKWEEPDGTVFYTQERIGRDGKPFLFYKFRSMKMNNDDTKHREYLKTLIEGKEGTNFGDKVKPIFKLKDDDRITKVGAFLRKYSLDELPQLINVLKGEMSLIGPRPPLEYEVEKYSAWHKKRLEVTPGCSGLWQISGRNALSFQEMVELDIFYIENWSIMLDISILLKTLPVLLKGDDAY